VIKTAHLRVWLPATESRFGELPQAIAPDRAPVQGSYGLVAESLADDVLTARWKEVEWVCPRTPRLRMLEGVLAIRNAYRELGNAEVIPEDTARAARRELAAIQEADPEVRAHILTSAWHVPVRWFVPFEPRSKEVVGAAGHTTVRYRVSHPVALRRLDRASEILADTDIPESITSEVSELRSWLADFPAMSMVELDYGTVATMFSEADLILDESVEEVWTSLDALAHGNWMKASEAYRSVVGRWALPMAVTYSN
jgi:hypothetical protein